nr:putative ribonuclease H-like domain-containing protein [Tanacetum cinerariifolium]
MTGNISYLSDFDEINGGYVSFGGNPKGGKITGKGKIRTEKFDFDDVYIVKELKFNLFSVSQMCDKKNSVLFTDIERIVLSFDFKLPDDNLVLLRAGAVNTACYVQNRVLVTKPYNKTPYELLLGRTPSIEFMRPFVYHVTILNTLDPLGNQPNSSVGIQESFDAGNAGKGNVQQYVLLPLWSTGSKDPQNTDADAIFEGKEPESEVHVSSSSSNKKKKHDEKSKGEAKGKSLVELSKGVRDLNAKFEEFTVNSTNGVNAVSTPITAVGLNSTNSTNNFSDAGPSNTAVSPNFKISGKSSFVDHSQYPDDPNMPELEDITYSDDEEDVGAEANFSYLKPSITVNPIPTSRVHKDHHVSQIMEEPKRVYQALKYHSWIEAMHEELLQFKMQKVWVLVDLPKRKRAIGSKWVFKNKKDERGIVVRNKARLVAQGHTQEEGIDYNEVFAPVVRIEAIRLFLAYAFFMGFMVYQMDVKSAFLYGTIEKEVYVCQPLGFEDPNYPDKVYKVVKALYGLHQAPRACQDKYVAKVLRKFVLTDGKSASTPIDTDKTLLKDPDVKRIFKYLKGKPHLGLWYPKDSPFNLVAYSDSDYAGASLDRKSTTGGYQFLGCRLISWQCKKQTVVATSSTEAEYVATASCCTQVLWIQNQLLDYRLIIIAISSKLMLFGLTIAVVHLMLLGHKDDVATVEDEDAANEISAEPIPPSPTLATTPPPQQELIPLLPQVENTPPPSPHQSLIAQPSLPPPQ